ncbi:MAG: LLM class flavin-dependent oxidoreductase [Acidimicrobiales bacterium]
MGLAQRVELRRRRGRSGVARHRPRLPAGEPAGGARSLRAPGGRRPANRPDRAGHATGDTGAAPGGGGGRLDRHRRRGVRRAGDAGVRHRGHGGALARPAPGHHRQGWPRPSKAPAACCGAAGWRWAPPPAWLRHARPVPVWVAAGGLRTLRMAGRAADGVFLRVGTHPANLRIAVEQVHAGAVEAGRDPADIGIGIIVHTVRTQEPAEVAAITRAMAAGFYEYSPALFSQAGLEWRGTAVEEAKRIWPRISTTPTTWWPPAGWSDFLDDDVAQSFSFSGTTDDVAGQLRSVLAAVPEAASWYRTSAAYPARSSSVATSAGGFGRRAAHPVLTGCAALSRCSPPRRSSR